MTAYEVLLKELEDRAGRYDYDGWVETASILEAAGLAIRELLGLFPHRCELCIGCEMEKEDGSGCDTGFILNKGDTKEVLEKWLKSRDKTRSIYCIEFSTIAGSSEIDYVAYFDKRKISGEKVIELIDAWGEDLNHPCVAVMEKSVAENVFGYQREEYGF